MPGWHGRAEPLADGPGLQQHRAAPRLAWDVHGNGKTAVRAGLGQFFLRERLSPGLQIAGNPPFTRTISGIRTLDSTAEPCDGCFGSTFGTPSSGRESRHEDAEQLAVEPHVPARGLAKATIEVGYVANYGYNLLRTHVGNQVLPGDSDHDGVDDRLQYVTTTPANAALRQYGVLGNTNIAIWDHEGKSNYNSLQTQFINRFGRGSQVQASYTLSRSRANIALTSSSGGLANNTTQLDNTNPDADWGRPETGRTHIFNASAIWMLSSLEGHSRADARRVR